MKTNVEVNNITSNLVQKSFVKSVVKKTFTKLNYSFLKNKNITISIAIVTPEEIRKLNKKYRKRDEVTDVLSFSEYKNIEKIKRTIKEKSDGKLFLGELILCYDYIRKYAHSNKLNLNAELSEVVSHGILHILGFRHGVKMFTIQNKIKDNFK